MLEITLVLFTVSKPQELQPRTISTLGYVLDKKADSRETARKDACALKRSRKTTWSAVASPYREVWLQSAALLEGEF